ncbi:MAG: FeoA family protein [Caldilinea sp.]|uniref:FeoA family protein n=1 Tax=Caldilinea sp. TaxID=2293560 RepID=UPI002B8646FA|nr:ferrous iron transport protein A [Anaerolineales bacterium]HQY93729.1 FeoA family protein [Caldilinea sp.]HRA66226.1 FeoA family protein [Caldilinea sp.]
MTTKAETLDQLPTGVKARVTSLTLTGAERRRMMDLGLLPGAAIEVALENPLGDPTAYRVRGAVIALRREQAQQIQIAREETLPPDAQGAA